MIYYRDLTIWLRKRVFLCIHLPAWSRDPYILTGNRQKKKTRQHLQTCRKHLNASIAYLFRPRIVTRKTMRDNPVTTLDIFTLPCSRQWQSFKIRRYKPHTTHNPLVLSNEEEALFNASFLILVSIKGLVLSCKAPSQRSVTFRDYERLGKRLFDPTMASW